MSDPRGADIDARTPSPASPPGKWWFVCDHPERPSDGWGLYHPAQDLCAGCVIGAEASLARGNGWAGNYLDLVGECEAEAGRPAVPGRPLP